jgi:hypothetical protein
VENLWIGCGFERMRNVALPEEEAQEKRKEGGQNAGLGKIPVFSFFFLFLLVCLVFNRLQFNRANSDDFVFGPAFRTRNHIALIHFIFFKVEVGVAFRTVNQSWPPFD